MQSPVHVPGAFKLTLCIARIAAHGALEDAGGATEKPRGCAAHHGTESQATCCAGEATARPAAAPAGGGARLGPDCRGPSPPSPPRACRLLPAGGPATPPACRISSAAIVPNTKPANLAFLQNASDDFPGNFWVPSPSIDSQGDQTAWRLLCSLLRKRRRLPHLN